MPVKYVNSTVGVGEREKNRKRGLDNAKSGENIFLFNSFLKVLQVKLRGSKSEKIPQCLLLASKV